MFSAYFEYIISLIISLIGTFGYHQYNKKYNNVVELDRQELAKVFICTYLVSLASIMFYNKFVSTSSTSSIVNPSVAEANTVLNKPIVPESLQTGGTSGLGSSLLSLFKKSSSESPVKETQGIQNNPVLNNMEQKTVSNNTNRYETVKNRSTLEKFNIGTPSF